MDLRLGLTWFRRSWLLPLLVGFLWFPVSAQTPDLINMADSLFDTHDYYNATTEYKRYIFFHPDSPEASDIFRQIGLCYRNQDEYKLAIDAFEKAIKFAPDDSVKDALKIDLAVTFMASGDFSASELTLLKINSFSKLNGSRQIASVYLGIGSIYQSKWKEAAQYLKTGLLDIDSVKAVQISKKLTDYSKIKYKSASKAKWMSTFIPGLGQAYAGEYLKGLNAIGLNTATGYLLMSSLIPSFQIWEATFSAPFFYRYWSGNRKLAAEYVIENRNIQNQILRQSILNDLEVFFTETSLFESQGAGESSQKEFH
jgi:tetratricopeptide (TPR) repeat protein